MSLHRTRERRIEKLEKLLVKDRIPVYVDDEKDLARRSKN
jgi:hypothetical protein